MNKFDMQSFVDQYNGKKLRMLFTGVGSYATGIMGVAGASKVLDSIFVPYSHEACAALLARIGIQDVSENHGSVSAEMASALHACNSLDLGDSLPITMTGAITTERYRRGDNQVFIAVGLPDEVDIWHLHLDKLSEAEHTEEAAVQKRYFQDRLASEVALCLGTYLSTQLVHDLYEGGHLVRV